MATNIFRHGNAAVLGTFLEARRDVDAIAIDIVTGDDDVAEVDADAQGDASIRLDRVVGFGDSALSLDGTFGRIDRTGELNQGAVAHELDHTAVMSSDDRVEYLGP